MQEIKPFELKGARTYFTGFDDNSYVTNDDNQNILQLERSLKVLLLTKNKIIFGASHLNSNLSKIIIKKAPILFEKGLIVPALRDNYNGDITKALNNQFYFNKNIFNSYISWNLNYNISWYKEKILEGFQQEKSLLRNNLKFTTSKDIKCIINLLSESEYFDRESEIYTKIIFNIDNRDLNNFYKYQNLVYNTSGARAVNCESSIDPKNMLFDYTIQDIKNKNIILSDVEIFHRIFIELVLNTLHRKNTMFDAYFIDSLEFDDIVHLRESIDNTNFIDKYNELIKISSKLLETKENINFHNIYDLLETSEQIYNNFKKNIEIEAKTYLIRKKNYKEEKMIYEPLYNLVRSFNPVSSYMDRTKNLIYFTRNIFNIIKNKKQEDYHINLVNNQSSLAENIAKKCDIDNRTVLVEVFKMLRQYTFEKYEGF